MLKYFDKKFRKIEKETSELKQSLGNKKKQPFYRLPFELVMIKLWFMS